MPAAGNRWDSSLNNVGSNGNYWSSSLNTDNPNNAWNFYFNSDNYNVNNNNRYYGFSVRPVSSGSQHLSYMSGFCLTRERLLTDLRQAYFDARRHKCNKPYQIRFEEKLEENLELLCDELFERRYTPKASSCFIITDPKKREVFAADFRDRIVHHLYYNYTHALFERTFIYDSYSCIKNRGTHFGIRRLYQYIRKESQNYTEQCYVMKMDVRGYFMHIDRKLLLQICFATIEKMSEHKVSRHLSIKWKERIDVEFVKYLTEIIVMLDPTKECCIYGCTSDWLGLAHDKSLFHSPEGCGLPIGNLTSQLFSNIYLNVLDQFMKRELNCKCYGRYVDDFYVVSSDKQWLLSLVPKVKSFLNNNLKLELHEGKLSISSIWQGVGFLGAWVKPHRIYTSRQCLGNIRRRLDGVAKNNPSKWDSSLNSYCGLLSHWNDFNLRYELFLNYREFGTYGRFDVRLKHYHFFYNHFNELF